MPFLLFSDRYKKKSSLKVSKSWKQFSEFSIIPKNERKTWKNYPKSSQDNFFSCFVCFFWKNWEFQFFLEIYWPLNKLDLYLILWFRIYSVSLNINQETHLAKTVCVYFCFDHLIMLHSVHCRIIVSVSYRGTSSL